MENNRAIRAVACDLDNTLFYSYKHRQADDICLEWLDGKEQSFTTPSAYEKLGLLTAQPGFVPVTTRSLAQLARIQWPGRPPHLALAANGGILLRNGAVDAEYAEVSRRSAAEAMPGLCWLLKTWKDIGIFKTVRIVDDLYIFGHAPDKSEQELMAVVKECSEFPAVRTASLTVQASGHKIYAFPPGISKGEGLKRLAQAGHMVPEWMAAGDSMIDLSMLLMAAMALVPEGKLAKSLAGEVKAKRCPAGCNFQEFVVDAACAWLNIMHR